MTLIDPTVTINPGTRFAFAPYTFPIEGGFYRIYVLFENRHGDLFGARTDIMAPSQEEADTICDTLNTRVDLKREQWKFFASAAFGAMEAAREQTGQQINTPGGPATLIPCDPDDDW